MRGDGSAGQSSAPDIWASSGLGCVQCRRLEIEIRLRKGGLAPLIREGSSYLELLNLELDDNEKPMLVALLKRTTAAAPFPLSPRARQAGPAAAPAGL